MKTTAYIIFILFVVFYSPAFSQTTVNGSFIHGGILRTFSYYVPANLPLNTPVPLVFGLHGTSSSGADFEQYRDFKPIADTAKFIMVHPDGSKMLGVRFWNFGNVLGSTVDDVGFIEALIDTIATNYSIDANRIYSVGMSNGGFMSYYLACNSDRFRAIGSVTGSMSTGMYNSCNPSKSIPVIHIHGTEDPTNLYQGNSTSKSIEDVVNFWVDQNGCETPPEVSNVPNVNVNDGTTAVHYSYMKDGKSRVEHFKVIGGEHTWPNCPMPNSSAKISMDFDARIEVWRFFSQFNKDQTASIEQVEDSNFQLFPNPAQHTIYLKTTLQVNMLEIYDIHGRLIDRWEGEQLTEINVSHLEKGNYRLRILGADFTYNRSILID